MQIKELEIGTIVKYIGHRTDNICIPPIGTIGVITYISLRYRVLRVKWSEGTRLDGEWFVTVDEVEKVK